jgi:hypothetical protein
MRRSGFVLSVLTAAGLLGGQPAHAFSVSGSAGLNASNAAQLRDPDEQVEHIANGSGPEVSSTWTDRSITSSGALSAGSAVAPGPDRWSRSWYGPSLVIAGRWTYPPSRP